VRVRTPAKYYVIVRPNVQSFRSRKSLYERGFDDFCDNVASLHHTTERAHNVGCRKMVHGSGL
jgi:hypothetical protein